MIFPIVHIGYILHIAVMEQSAFKNEVEKFMLETGMAATTFGREALSDPNFVSRMRKGARSWPETQRRCLDFMSKLRGKPEVSK